MAMGKRGIQTMPGSVGYSCKCNSLHLMSKRVRIACV